MRISEIFRNRLDLAYHIPDYLSQRGATSCNSRMISSVEYFLQDFANGGHADNGDFLGHLDTCQGIFGA